jgi:hypothetical protein
MINNNNIIVYHSIWFVIFFPTKTFVTKICGNSLMTTIQKLTLKTIYNGFKPSADCARCICIYTHAYIWFSVVIYSSSSIATEKRYFCFLNCRDQTTTIIFFSIIIASLQKKKKKKGNK